MKPYFHSRSTDGLLVRPMVPVWINYSLEKSKIKAQTRRPPKPAPQDDFVQSFKITQSAYDAIRETLGQFPAETGGLLLGNAATGLVTHFLFDEDARTSGVIYYPTVEFLNNEIPKYEALGIHPLGIAHSHPAGMKRPSGPDLSAAYNNITSPHNGHLRTWHLPIIQSVADNGKFTLYPYIVSCSADGEAVLHHTALEVVPHTSSEDASNRKPKKKHQWKEAFTKEAMTSLDDAFSEGAKS